VSSGSFTAWAPAEFKGTLIRQRATQFAKRLGSTTIENGLERHKVASMEDALALSRRLAAA